ncbi:HDIG domain-containing protein [Massilia sp. PDC64]|nr:HD-GYP domain-containing protein [Massilia sp. PDC64]SDD92648.1 HDIG domain-containing protein [Massilia sp. PDC64]
MADTLTIPIDQVQIGLYIHLDLKWFQHPFAFSHFKVKTEDQLRILRGLGLATVRVDPALSDVAVPAPTAAPTRPVPAAPVPVSPESRAESPVMAAKREMMERIREQRENAARIEQAFVNTARAIRDIDRNLFSQPAETIRVADKLIGQITESILSAPELAINLMGDKLGGEEIYVHSLNVTMLSMMIARDIKLPHEVASLLGMGALFHDVGTKNIPDKVLNKLDAYNHAEQALVETHCHGGFEIGQKLGLAAPALAIIRDHHELFDGSGYPRHLQGEAIGVLARIVSIANHYDELCNPRNPADSLTPHEALSLMFAKMRSRFDPKLLQVFIRCLGVYPPGTIVQLANGVVGMCVNVNTAKPTRPQVMIYEADVPREEAIVVNLETQPDLNIVKSIRPSQVPKDIYNYLSPRKRVSYYFDASDPARRSQP